MFSQQLILGSVYRLKFKGPFERHGVCTTSGLTCLHKGNGTFRLEAITTFRSLVLSGVKLYDNFFMPVGIPESEYRQYYDDKPADEYVPEYVIKGVKNIQTVSIQEEEGSTGSNYVSKRTLTQTQEVWTETGNSILSKHVEDSVNYAKYPIYKFVDVIDVDDVVYVPALTLAGFPEIELSEYKNLSLVLHLGYFGDPTKLDPMLLALRERMCIYGIKPKHIKLYSTGSQWLNRDEYEKIKTVRLPSYIETIPPNAIEDDYVGKRVIINDSVRNIVASTDGEGDPVSPTPTSIPFSNLQSHETILDRRLFDKTVEPLDIFNGNSRYYEIMQDGGKRLLTDSETILGDEVMKMEEFTFESGMTIPEWQKVYSGGISAFIPMPYGAPRIEGLWKKYIYHYDEETDTVEYIPASTWDLENKHRVLYRKVPGNYSEVAHSSLVAGRKYYKSVPRSTGGTGTYVMECYTKEDVLSLLNTTFIWTDNTSAQRTITGLTHADIIDLSSRNQLEDIQLVYDGEYDTSTETFLEKTERRFLKWQGRIFRVKMEIDGVETTVDYNIPSEPSVQFIGLTGSIVGQVGLVSREINFLDENVVDRNYYLRYMEQQKELARLTERCSYLEEVIKSLKT